MTGRLLQTVLRQAEALAAGADAVSDAELLARFAKSRDEPAFAALVRRHGPMVWAVCRHLLPNPADAEDAFQATFLALVQSASKVRAGSAVGAWLHGVAVRAAAKLKRSAARRKQREERAAGPEADRSVSEGAWDELLAAVHEEVGRLPEALRTAFVLCDLEGVRQPDAAARLGWKPGTLSGRLTKARQQLLARLADRGIAAGAVAVGTAAAGAAVPSALAGKVLALTTAAADAVSPVIWELALEVTPMTVNKTKLIAACVLVAGGLGIGVGSALVPGAGAQGPGPGLGNPVGAGGPLPSPDVGGAGLSPDGAAGEEGAGPAGSPDSGMGMPGMMGGGAPASPRWEYHFDALPGSVDAFRKLVVKRGQEGWEFTGAVAVKGTAGAGMMPGEGADPSGMAGIPGMSAGPVTQLVFKRPVRSKPARAGGDMGSPDGQSRAGRGGFGSPSGSMPGPGGMPGGFPGGMAGGMMPGMGAMPSFGGASSQPAGGFQVIGLKHATASDLAGTLTKLFANIQAVPDVRTNSLILKADANTLKEVKELIQKLDVAGPAPPQGENPYAPQGLGGPGPGQPRR